MNLSKLFTGYLQKRWQQCVTVKLLEMTLPRSKTFRFDVIELM